jgi:gas vesicle protein
MADEKKPKKMNKLVKGMIIGGAIGSIMGMTLAPKSGKETREILHKKSSGAVGGFFRGMRALIQGRKEKK